jgi:hypothetical protein
MINDWIELSPTTATLPRRRSRRTARQRHRAEEIFGADRHIRWSGAISAQLRGLYHY